MSNVTKSNTFKAPEGFSDSVLKEQGRILGAWIAANPTATIKPIKGVVAEGALPAYIRRATGKRADINAMMVKGMPVAKFLPLAAALGGGYPDIIAGLNGGYSRSSTQWGRPAFTITA